MSAMDDEGGGIVTSSCHDYFDGLLMLIASLGIARCRMPVICFDVGLGLTDENRLSAQNVAAAASVSLSFQTLDSTPHVVGAPLTKFESSAWNKPFFVTASGFRRVVWIDSDIVVLTSPAALLHMRSPFFTPDTFAGLAVRNPSALYRLRPVPPGSPEDRLSVNAGMFMVARDAPILKAWQGFIREALLQPYLRHLINCQDQGALIWSILQLGQSFSVVDSDSWNRPANGKTSDPESAYARTVYPRPVGGDYRPLIEAIRQDHPGASAVHWVGAPKLWQLWTKQDEQLASAKIETEKLKAETTKAKQSQKKSPQSPPPTSQAQPTIQKPSTPIPTPDKIPPTNSST
jgi:hypothetical protein